MNEQVKIGIIICNRYRRCAGGKCLRALRNREGAFSIYADQEVELVGYTTCDGCPGGNIEYAGEEMVKNGAQVIHLATGLVVGYPPCPSIETFKAFLRGAVWRTGRGGHASHSDEVSQDAHLFGNLGRPIVGAIAGPHDGGRSNSQSLQLDPKMPRTGGKVTQLPEAVSQAWEQREGPIVLTTVDRGGNPNAIYATCVRKVSDDTLVVADNFFNKTRANILAGSKATLLFITKEGQSYQVKGPIEYHAEGEVLMR